MVTIKDVARDANVSISTVSRVVNSITTVDADLAKRVEISIKKLNYKPNLSARSLVMQKSKLIGIIVEDISNPFHGEHLQSLMQLDELKNYNYIVCDNNYSEEKCIENFDNLVGRKVDAIKYLSMKRYTDAVKNKIIEVTNSGIPVIIPHTVGLENYPCVYIDDSIADKEAMQYLYDLGHRNIGVVSKKYNDVHVTRRVNSVKEFMIDHNLSVDHSVILLEAHEEPVDTIKKALNEFHYTAIVTVEDIYALYVYKAARACNLSIPEDLSVVGCHDIAISKYLTPALTSIKFEVDDFSKAEKDLLKKLLDGSDKDATQDNKRIIYPKFITRESCARRKDL